MLLENIYSTDVTQENWHMTTIICLLYRPLTNRNDCILSSIVPTFYIENDAEIFPVHYTWKVAEKGFKMAIKMN